MAINYDNSAKGVIMTYVNLVNVTTPVIVTAAGIEDWLALDEIEEAIMEVGCDGSLISHIVPAMAKGKITLLPLSPALINAFISTQQTQYTLGAPIPGTLTVASATGLWTISFQNFIITSAFKGYEFGQKVKDVPISFSAQIPNTTILGDLLSIGEAIAGL